MIFHIETQASIWMLKTQSLKGLYEFFLLFSSLSERAPRETKMHYAFKIYDFDQDNFIGMNDIEQAVKLLTQVINSKFQENTLHHITEPAHCRGGPKNCGKGVEKFQRYIIHQTNFLALAPPHRHPFVLGNHFETFYLFAERRYRCWRRGTSTTTRS